MPKLGSVRLGIGRKANSLFTTSRDDGFRDKKFETFAAIYKDVSAENGGSGNLHGVFFSAIKLLALAFHDLDRFLNKSIECVGTDATFIFRIDRARVRD